MYSATEDGETNTTSEVWITLATSLCVLAIVAFAYHKLERNRGADMKSHIVYWGAALLIMIFIPTTLSKYAFSALSVTIMGTVFPIYESVRAICTPEEGDDKAWSVPARSVKSEGA